MGISQNWGYLFGGPNNKDYSILGTILGSLYLGKLPCRVCAFGAGGEYAEYIFGGCRLAMKEKLWLSMSASGALAPKPLTGLGFRVMVLGLCSIATRIQVGDQEICFLALQLHCRPCSVMMVNSSFS